MSLKLLGHIGSPYSRKMRSYLRFKQIDYQWIQTNTPEAMELPASKIPIIPVVYFKDENFGIGHTDSSPLIKSINNTYGNISTSPNEPVLSFLCDLLEDFADEWVNKLMFYYRFKYNGNYNSRFLLLATNPSMDDKELNELSTIFENRQIETLSKVICSNDECCKFLEQNYVKILQIWDSILSNNNFLFGSRPSSADFSFFGQFSQLVLVDPTPREIASKNSFRVRPWCESLEDLSGMDITTKSWIHKDLLMTSKPHQDLFKEVNDIYLPLLKANHIALEEGKDEYSVRLDGIVWKQRISRYHKKCLHSLVESYQNLSSNDKDFVRRIGINMDICDNLSSHL